MGEDASELSYPQSQFDQEEANLSQVLQAVNEGDAIQRLDVRDAFAHKDMDDTETVTHSERCMVLAH